MGGNVTAMNKRTGETVRAQKIMVKDIGRREFMDKFVEIFKKMNSDFKKRFKRPIWVDEKILTSGFVFNGSTSFIMDPTLSDEEVMAAKPSAGDIDITVPEELKEDLWTYLDSIEGKDIIPGCTYWGSNKPTMSSIGEQINSVIVVDFPNGQRAYAQVDFEFLPFEDNRPTEWAKFSHSSSFADAKESIKAVNHKYLIRALVGGASIRDDIIIATNASTYDKIKLRKMADLPRMLKFSVGRGIRVAYEPIIDPTTNKIVEIDGKQVYKEIPTDRSDYKTIVAEIYKLAFQQLTGNEDDIKKFESFVGMLDLMKRHLSKKQIKDTHDRYIDLLWGTKGQRGQELEVGNPELDFQVKSAGYQRFIKELKLPDVSVKMAEEYYKNYGQRGLRESFRSLIESSFCEWEEA